MKKQIGIMLLIPIMLLTGCSFFGGGDKDEAPVDEMIDEQTIGLSPEVQTQEKYYRSVLYDGVYPHGESRGLGDSVVYNRHDLEQLELGLTNIAKNYFDVGKYYFQEGHYIGRDELNNWLRRLDESIGRDGKPKNPEGLNPPLGEGATTKEREENQPRYLSHILEHNYFVEKGDGQFELGGVVIGISLNSVYHFRVEDAQGRYYFYEKELNPQAAEKAGKEVAEKVVERLRSESRADGALNNVPIVVALFQEMPRESAVPGHFFAQTKADPKRGLDSWQKVNEAYYLFPSKAANDDVRQDADQFMKLKEEINDLFEKYVGVVGKGYYVNNSLQELTIEVPIRYEGKTEIIALTQFIADKIKKFPSKVKIQVYVTSVAGQESLIVKNPEEEPFIHIYR